MKGTPSSYALGAFPHPFLPFHRSLVFVPLSTYLRSLNKIYRHYQTGHKLNKKMPGIPYMVFFVLTFLCHSKLIVKGTCKFSHFQCNISPLAQPSLQSLQNSVKQGERAMENIQICFRCSIIEWKLRITCFSELWCKKFLSTSFDDEFS